MLRLFSSRNIYLEILLDFGVFFATIILAAKQNWQTTDIVWSLWVSSFLLGYLYILLAMAGFVNQADTPIRGLWGDIFILLNGLFLLAFFSFHFGFFHLIHAIFLDDFFPFFEPGGPKMDLAVAAVIVFMGELLKRYWPFLVFSALSRWKSYVHAYNTNDHKKMMYMPYGNVVRMHLMILLFGFLSAATDLQGYALYIVLIFYFFPFKTIWDALWSKGSL